MRLSLVAKLAVFALAMSAPAPAAAQEKVRVVATFSIVADLVRQIGGDAIDLTTLAAADQDTHGFEPGAADQRAVAAADLIIANGLGFEPWLDRLTDAAGFEGRIVNATDGIAPLALAEAAHGEGEPDHDHDHGDADPHAFQDARLVLAYIDNIAAGLAALRPASEPAFAAGAAALKAEFAALDEALKADFARLPPAHRRVLTTHDAFAYFGRAYGIEFVSIQGISTEAEPSAADFKAIFERVEAGDVRAAFLENMTDPRLVETLGADTGIALGGTLYADALSAPDGPAPTLQALFRHNAAALLDALR